ncbi:hypothetical protein [Phyllobacterium sophorae]|uniref:hypothetical protein n=1 Tax=Phyllobacterium sophorae TaxID=1520277 RepID=UPI0011B28591|nr:hypothetical protein [Phyllobacterium sophorae]
MAGSIWDWSLTPSNNDTADGDINWVEGQLPSTVNNSARQMMTRVKQLLNDISGSNTSTGTASAYNLTASSSFTTLTDGRVVSFKAHINNDVAATININLLGAKSLRRLTSSGDTALVANDICSGGIYTLVYSSTAASGTGGWIVTGYNRAAAGDLTGIVPNASISGAYTGFTDITASGTITATEFVGAWAYLPAGTRMLFQQTNAPPGWTKDTTHNNKALRLVSGSVSTGGSTAFTTVFASRTPAGTLNNVVVTGTVGATTLTTAQIPSHTHAVSGTTGTVSADHSHNYSGTTSTNGSHAHSNTQNLVTAGGSGSTGVEYKTNDGFVAGFNTNAAGDHAHTYSGTTSGISTNHTHSFSVTSGAAGTGGSHTHSLTMDTHGHTFTGTAMDFAVAYVDFIVAQKN